MSFKCCARLLSVSVLTNSVKSYSKYINHRQLLTFTSPQLATSYITPSFLTAQKAFSTQIFNKVVEPPKQNVPKVVYMGLLTPQIKAVKIFSLTSSIVGIIAQPFLYKEIASTGNIPIILAAYSFIGFFTFVTPILLHLVTRKYVTELHYKRDTDSYIAKTVNFFCVTKKTEFKIEDVKVPEVPGMFTTLYANGKPLFLDPRSFDNPEHYAKLMGYDKPIDLKLYEAPNEKKD